MSIDAEPLATLFKAFATIPNRLAALERESAETKVLLAAIHDALPPTFLSVADAAHVLKVSVPTMRRWIRSGDIPVVRIGSTVRVEISRLKAVDSVEVGRLARVARRP